MAGLSWIASLWTMPPWQNIVLGACLCLAMIVEQRIYPLPEPDDPTNRGWLWVLHTALAFSQWVFVLVGACVLALGILRLFG